MCEVSDGDEQLVSDESYAPMGRLGSNTQAFTELWLRSSL